MPLPKKVLIIHPEGNAFNNPSLKCIIDLLIENDVEVRMRYCKSNAIIPLSYNLKLFPYSRIHHKIKRVIFDKICNQTLINIYVKIVSKYYQDRFDLVLGIDRMGLIEAFAISRIKKTPYVFISFEILFESETSNKFKSIERVSASKVKGWFVQDIVRQQCLIQENKLHKKNSILLPLASAGLGVFNKERLRDELGVPNKKKVAILMGSINNWSMVKEIVDSVNKWGDKWVLVIHSRFGNTISILKKLNIDKELYLNKIYISNYPSEVVDDMGYILNGISAGIALYKPIFNSPLTGKNLQYLGMSSGKISTFLRYGIPVIMNDIGLYSSIASENGIGVVVQTPYEIGTSLDKIAQNEDKYHINAIEYFTRELDFNNFKDIVYDNLLTAMEDIPIRKD